VLLGEGEVLVGGPDAPRTGEEVIDGTALRLTGEECSLVG
jgi:hypothetical protein